MSTIVFPQPKAGKPEITMAPLVDIVFLLLIFFMVTTVFPENDGIPIEKPTSENSVSIADRKFMLKLDQNGLAYYKEQLVNADDIKRLIKQEILLSQNVTVLVHADRRSTTEQLINVIDAAKSGGARSLGIATDVKPANQ